MTRWARSKNALKHSRQPEGATSWDEFVAQRRAGDGRASPAANRSSEKDSKHSSLTVQGQRGIHRSLNGGPKKCVPTSVEAKEGHEMRNEAVDIGKYKSDRSTMHVGERESVERGPKQLKAKKTDGSFARKEIAPSSVQRAKKDTMKVRNRHDELEMTTNAKKSDRERTVVKVSRGGKDDVENEVPSKRKGDSSKGTGVREAKFAKTSVKEGANATPTKLPKEVLHSGSGEWQVTELCEVPRNNKGTKMERNRKIEQDKKAKTPGKVTNADEGHVAGGDTGTDKATKPASKEKWLQRLRKEREKKGIILLPPKVEKRIYAMKKAMRQKGASGEEIKAVVRRLRRKEELFFRRQLKKVCLRCRQPGHMVSDCPLVTADTDEAMGICFKCGSTEHFSSKCTVQTNPDKEFPYARCFICKQEGHISRKCPRNKRGIYPKGGHCNFCGAVDHFKANCPQMQKNKKKADEEEEVTGEVMDILGSADAEPAPQGYRETPAKPRVVTF